MSLLPRREPQIPCYLTFGKVMEFMPPATSCIGTLSPQQYEFFQCGEQVSFELDAVGFSAINAWYLSDCSYLAYTTAHPPNDVETVIFPALRRMMGSQVKVKIFRASPHRELESAPSDGVQCFVAHGDNFGVVAFRGTMPNSPSNWLTDLETLPVEECLSGQLDVHDGFKQALDGLWGNGNDDGLAHYLEHLSTVQPTLKWWFTGHSLGAALATLAASRFGHPLALYTFGSPRVGNDAFARRLDNKVSAHFRVVNHHDLVTHVPFSPPFEHAGQLIYVEESSASELAFVQLRNDFDLSKELNQLFHSELAKHFDSTQKLILNLQSLGLMRAMLDHAPIFYSKLLWNFRFAPSGPQVHRPPTLVRFGQVLVNGFGALTKRLFGGVK